MLKKKWWDCNHLLFCRFESGIKEVEGPCIIPLFLPFTPFALLSTLFLANWSFDFFRSLFDQVPFQVPAYLGHIFYISCTLPILQSVVAQPTGFSRDGRGKLWVAGQPDSVAGQFDLDWSIFPVLFLHFYSVVFFSWLESSVCLGV